VDSVKNKPDPAAKAVALMGRPPGQIGILVHDLEAAAARYSTLWGNGPWRCWTYGDELLRERIHRGRPSRFSVRIALNASTPQLELLEPIRGPSIYHEWLDQHGESLHHIGIYVDSLEQAIASMQTAGYTLIQCGLGTGLDGDGGFAYFDTQHELGLTLEAIERPLRRHEPELIIP
jgi:hypothetical protein